MRHAVTKPAKRHHVFSLISPTASASLDVMRIDFVILERLRFVTTERIRALHTAHPRLILFRFNPNRLRVTSDEAALLAVD